jgi:hypothetical protein
MGIKRRKFKYFNPEAYLQIHQRIVRSHLESVLTERKIDVNETNTLELLTKTKMEKEHSCKYDLKLKLKYSKRKREQNLKRGVSA